VEIAEEFQGLISRLQQVRQGVFWIEKMLPRREIVQMLTKATALVCPSVYEPFGLVNLEAMACETAVVATRTGGIPEIVVDGETGFLVPLPGGQATGEPSDPVRFAEELAERINRLIDDPSLATSMGKAGRRRVVDHFTWAAAAGKTAALYESLVGAGS
jgi:starch synthase